MKKSQLYSLMLLGFLCSHCSEAEDPEMACPVVAVSGPDDDVVRKWKLVKGQAVFYEPRTEDYSCSDIVYHFQEDGQLVISSTIEGFQGFSAGQHNYEFLQAPLFDHDYTLKVESVKIPCSVSGSSMILDDSALDGPILHLARIQ